MEKQTARINDFKPNAQLRLNRLLQKTWAKRKMRLLTMDASYKWMLSVPGNKSVHVT